MLYFAHIPKCGGTTAKQLFYAAVGRQNCMKVWNTNFGADIDPKDFASLTESDFNSVKAIVGHLPFNMALRNKHVRSLHERGDLRVMTIVRDPVDRRISLLNYMTTRKDHPDHDKVASMDPIRFIMAEPWNFQTRFLRTDETDSTESILERMTVFTIDQSEEKVRHWLEKHTASQLDPTPIANVTAVNFPNESLFHRKQLTCEQLSDFRKLHHLDYALLERCE